MCVLEPSKGRLECEEEGLPGSLGPEGLWTSLVIEVHAGRLTQVRPSI